MDARLMSLISFIRFHLEDIDVDELTQAEKLILEKAKSMLDKDSSRKD